MQDGWMFLNVESFVYLKKIIWNSKIFLFKKFNFQYVFKIYKIYWKSIELMWSFML